MPISYFNPKQEIRLSAYADTIVLEPDGREQRLRAIRFGGYPEMVRAMSDAIYAGATLETEFAGETARLTCEPKKYECHLSHDGIYAEATILSLDDEDAAAKKGKEAQADGQTNVELPPRKCVLFCPAGDRRALFEALDRKTAVPLIPEFQDYVLDELQRRRFLKPLRVISIRERLEAWLLLCKKDDANIVKVLEEGLKTGAIHIPGTVQAPHGFDDVHSVTSYLSAFGVTVAERIREQFQPLFDPAAEQLSPEVLRINDYIRAHAGYSLYPAQLAVAESVKRKLSEGKSAFIVAECGSGKTKIGATALAAYQAQKWKKTFNIILCPSHVAKKWVREIAETLPDTVGVIVRSIVELDSLYAQYRQGDKSICAVISKEKARDGYMRRPAVLFDARKGAFRCPSCGEIIELPSSDEEDGWTTAKPEAFRMENRRNHQCMSCDGPLWTAVNPSVPSPWVKIPEYGWVHRKLAVHAMQKTKNPAALDALLSLHENPDGYFPTRGACRRYPLSSYIKKRYRGRLDGLIVDELHEYNNDSGQGDAMAELFGTAKKVIGMTATLINGYSSGIFHLLYRTSAQLMLADGKPHEKPALFNTEYGVVETTYHVNRLVLHDITFKDPVTYACTLDTVSYFTVANIIFDFNYGNPFAQNMDGIHMNGNCNYGLIQNLKGACYDDLVALNADEGSRGPITNIRINGIFAENCHSAVRLLTVDNPVEHIHISDIFGTFYTYCIGITKFCFERETTGYFDGLVFDNIHVSKAMLRPEYHKEEIYGIQPVVLIERETITKSLSISNLFRSECNMPVPTIGLQNNAFVDHFNLRSCFNRGRADMQYCFVNNNGLINDLFMQDVHNENGEIWSGNQPKIQNN